MCGPGPGGLGSEGGPGPGPLVGEGGLLVGCRFGVVVVVVVFWAVGSTMTGGPVGHGGGGSVFGDRLFGSLMFLLSYSLKLLVSFMYWIAYGWVL